MTQEKKENIISFPTNKIVRNIPSEQKKKLMDKQFLDEISEITYSMGEDIQEMIQSVTPEKFNEDALKRDLSFSVAIITAMVYRMHGLDHPLQEFIDDHVSILSEKEVMEIKFTPEFDMDPPVDVA